jgi:hypothetical protein
MNRNRIFLITLVSVISAVAVNISLAQAQAPAQVAKSIGVIKAINGNAITVAPASGPEVTANVQSNARILRLTPGESDIKNATPISLEDVHVGDTVRVRGYASADGKSIATLEVIVITQSAVSAMSDQIRQDWQKHGIGGLVSAVDSSTGTITISITSFSGKKTIAVHTSKSTVVRRYAPDSVKFEDAKASTLGAIQPGDQLRARGERNADGSELNAVEVVTGSFPFVVGTVKSVDASAGTLSVEDILTKKTVDVKVTADSKLHKIPAEMAQRFAMRLKGGGTPPGGSAGSTTAANNGQTQAGASPSGQGSSGMRPGGAPDFQQMLSRLPSSTLADLQLQKGDAVVILATEGTPASASTAITLLSGVEPILQAAPNASQAMMLSPWSIGGAPGGDAGNQ